MLLDYGMLMQRLRRKPTLLMWIYKFSSSSFLAAREFFCVGWLVSAEKKFRFFLPSLHLFVSRGVICHAAKEQAFHSKPIKTSSSSRAARVSQLIYCQIARQQHRAKCSDSHKKKRFVQSISICIIYTPAGLEDDSSHCQLLSVSQKAKEEHEEEKRGSNRYF